MTAAASRRIPYSRCVLGVFAGQSHPVTRSECCASVFRRFRPRAGVLSLRRRLGEPSRRRSRRLEASGLRCGGRWPKPLSVTARSHEWRRAREHRSELHLVPSRSLGPGASSEPDDGRSQGRGSEATLLEVHGRSSERLPGSLRASWSRSVRRSGRLVTVDSRGASHRFITEVICRCKTRSGNSTTSPMGFGSFRRLNPGDRCVGLPLRHHPLSEFLTPSAV